MRYIKCLDITQVPLANNSSEVPRIIWSASGELYIDLVISGQITRLRISDIISCDSLPSEPRASAIYKHQGSLKIYKSTGWETVTTDKDLDPILARLTVINAILTGFDSDTTVYSVLETKADVTAIPTQLGELYDDVGYVKAGEDITGNAASADKLAQARTITVSGGVTGSASFDGSADINIETTLTAVSWDSLKDKPTIPTNADFTLANLGEKSYNSLTDIPDLSTKADLVDGRVPAQQLPSYVDDVVECYTDVDKAKLYTDESKTEEITPETGKIYVDIVTNIQYRWGGTKLVELSKSLALGETAATAFPGDRGKLIEDALAGVLTRLEAL